MPEIKNTFLKSKMNKDLDDRLIPNGEYRDAQNLQISRSQGSSVGEFENVLGNTEVADLLIGDGADIIGQFTNEKNNKIYIISTGYSGAANCPRDKVAYSNIIQSGTTITLATLAGVVVDPQASGIQVGMLLRGDTWNGVTPTIAPVVTNVTATNITLDTTISLLIGEAMTIGFANTIHELTVDISPNPLKLLAVGSFLNFSKTNKIFGINLLDDLLYWTDNRNQPRKINVELANPIPLNTPTHYTREDQISVAKYYPYEVPLVLNEVALTAAQVTAGAYPAVVAAAGIRGFEITLSADPATLGVKIGDIVTGFPGQGSQELWEVIWMEAGGTFKIVVYNNFLNTPGTAGAVWGGGPLTFSRSTMTNESDTKNENSFDTAVYTPVAAPGLWDPNTALFTLSGALPANITAGNAFFILYRFSNTVSTNDTPNPIPKVGDYITSDNFSGNVITIDPAGTTAITRADEVLIQSVDTLCLDDKPSNRYALITLTKQITINTSTDQLRVGANPDYNSSFTGDTDLIEERFVRFSYRFKYEDNEYSLSAPFSQICFIPKQLGEFGWGQSDVNQDMDNTFASTILEWFENRIDSIALKIPLPDGGTSAATALTSLQGDYKVKSIDILVKESDGLATRIIKTIPVADIDPGDIEPLPNTSGTQFYYNFDYKSTKVYKTLSSSQQNRVYDKVPIKALAQEISANRVIYGNFVSQHTPPNDLDYSVINGNKSLTYNNYTQYPNHSVKQNRNYQVGFVLSDRVGRASSVVLSLNDDIPNTAGSTLYVPYKSWDDVQSTALSTYKWLGNSLNLTINSNTNIDFRPSADGQPGLYKSYPDSGADDINIDVAGTGYLAGVTYATTYNPAAGGTPQALGSGLTVKVITIGGAGDVTSVELVNPGIGYISGEKLQLVGGGNDCIIEERMWDPNPLGWQSYKIVVKQQEQEYYNAYLPGFIAGYPVTLSTDAGRVAFSTLINDNINKIPRDLNEVGPLQNEFPSSVRLFGRVNNPNIDNKGPAFPAPYSTYYNLNITYLWNQQYFPQRIFDEVTTVGPVGQGGLELANSPFDGGALLGPFENNVPPTPSRLPWGTAGGAQSFYNVEQNPLAGIIRVGEGVSQPQLTVEGNFLNTLGAQVATNVLPIPNPDPYPGAPYPANNLFCMEPFLSISETEPVESNLDIFYESSTSNNFVDLYKSL
jgi:hypothetical protein